jgi:hypothetical protein
MHEHNTLGKMLGKEILHTPIYRPSPIRMALPTSNSPYFLSRAPGGLNRDMQVKAKKRAPFSRVGRDKMSKAWVRRLGDLSQRKIPRYAKVNLAPYEMAVLMSLASATEMTPTAYLRELLNDHIAHVITGEAYRQYSEALLKDIEGKAPVDPQKIFAICSAYIASEQAALEQTKLEFHAKKAGVTPEQFAKIKEEIKDLV